MVLLKTAETSLTQLWLTSGIQMSETGHSLLLTRMALAPVLAPLQQVVETPGRSRKLALYRRLKLPGRLPWLAD